MLLALLVLMSINFATHANNPLFAADLIIVNANIHTMDRSHPAAAAIAIHGNRIIAVGSNDEIKKLAGADTKVIDAKRRLVLPGFNDAHVHFMSGGFQLSSVDLRDANTPQEFAERIRDFAARLPKGRWITGGDWDHERWPDAKLPTKELIDRYTPDTPVFVNRLDGHMALANSLALKLAGVTRETKDPPGGVIVRDSKTGEPTGILKDAAQSFVWKVIPAPSFEEKLAAARAATNHAASLGVTSVQDMSAGADVSVYQVLLDRGELKNRIYAVWPLPRWERLAQTGVRAHFGSAMLRTGGLKGFADGSLGSTTALFFQPYNDAPNTNGIPSDEMFPEGAMLERVRGADQAGLQVIIHAIDDGRWAEKRIGPERAKTTYAFRSLLDSGATLAFGTDWTVAPLNPMLTIYAGVTRRTLDGKHPNGWIPEQKISVEEAVRAYTVGSAFAEFQENEKGTIAPGKLADLVILTQDIFKIDPKEIEKVKVAMTIMDGRVVYVA